MSRFFRTYEPDRLHRASDPWVHIWQFRKTSWVTRSYLLKQFLCHSQPSREGTGVQGSDQRKQMNLMINK